MLFKSIFKIAQSRLVELSWQWVAENVGPSECQYSQCPPPAHICCRPTLACSVFRPQCCCPYLQTWAGSHFKTNILDIMYISDFYSRAYSFLPAWSWNHWLRGGSAMAKWKIQHQGIALDEAFNILHFFQCLKYPMYSIEHNTNVDSLASGLLYPLAYECAAWKCRVL